MNEAANIMTQDGEIPVYDAVKNLSNDELEQTVKKNAAAKKFALNEEHWGVIHTLVDHYRHDCNTRDCLAAHEQMRFLEEAYESEGGSKYLYLLFDTPHPEKRGVLSQIHELAGLPGLRLDTDKGFGTTY